TVVILTSTPVSSVNGCSTFWNVSSSLPPHAVHNESDPPTAPEAPGEPAPPLGATTPPDADADAGGAEVDGLEQAATARITATPIAVAFERRIASRTTAHI